MSTVSNICEVQGIGLHSGVTTTLRILPTEPGLGRYFVRVDLPDAPQIPAHIANVSQTTLSTELTANGASVRTVEHLLAALAALGIEDARIEIDGAELPLLDGSARVWVEKIVRSQIEPVPRNIATSRVLTEPVWIQQDDIFVAALPSPVLQFTYGIDFDVTPIGNQWHSWRSDKEDFTIEIAPARTFGLAHQIEQLRSAGLIKGGSLDNALVCDDRQWLNPPLRFPNEPSRHKLLDLIGDLSLLGKFPQAHFLAYKASHQLHVRLAQRLHDMGY
ncbi:UDP-3-O-acyl-N-acetylglucosamine deacetylase [Chamaesiphon minutus]|uniref:UDP-3-O-acyl-N-acetylglucosamine deacetylase n=1 Tax=Chamaesiphon minutus (strain ATCC 27169 / PCC 6605) TaxID=1173020 RepID=K9UIB3_CHAP6|nr:UDP-3-O-acyl-N-acetylglucosamine deacetylase [Chamaesiphon minutus]AFY94555.1 UDP-3-0-acyl N-acetylglucosamine deacetylase [Chamaesiphon minutus PCC 6605]